MNFKQQILFLMAVSALTTGSSACSHVDDRHFNYKQDIRRAAITEMKSSSTPSLQISIGKGDRLIYAAAFGLSDIENNVPATAATKYRIASVAKWFTATAAMRLAADGVLDMDQPLQTYCPQFPDKQWAVTTRQVVTHTAGIRHYIDYDQAIAAADSDKQKQLLLQKQLQETLSAYTRHTDVISPLATFKDDPLLFEPGTAWEYTSYGYRLLACVLQGAAQQSYQDLMQQLVFSPAGMTDTVPDDAWAIIPHRASGYYIEGDKSVRKADIRDVSENLPAGGYLSTATDLVKFAQKYNTSLVTDNDRQVMSAPVMGKIDVDSPHSWRDAIPQQDKYGYGLMLFSKYEEGMIGHTGRQDGGSAILVLLPQQQISIAIMTNAKGWNGYLDLMMKFKDITERYFPMGSLHQ